MMSEMTKSKGVKLAVATLITGAAAALPIAGVHAISAGTGVTGIVTNQTGGFQGLVIQITNIIVGIVGSVAVLALIYGGLRYVISAGNEDDIEKAKNIIMYAIIGIVVIIIAYVIVQGIAGLFGVQGQ